MGYGNGPIRSLYYSFPLAAKNFLASGYGWNERRVRYGRIYFETLDFLRHSQYWPNERLLDYQFKRSHEFLGNVIDRTPYYRVRDHYKELLRSHAQLEAFPLLTKADLRRKAANFYHDELRSMKCRWVQTSGTTGSALIFPVSRQHFQRECAFRAVAYEWAGISLDARERVAVCAGHPVTHQDRERPPFWVRDWANNSLYFSSYHLTRQNLRHYVAELERFDPVMLAGYPSSLHLLALAYGKFGGKLRLRSILTSSETLHSWQRARIESAFGAKIFDYYGLAENCAHVAECEAGEHHMKLEYSAVTVLNHENDPCGPGETGRLVCTGFSNRAFPLIRYDVGDVVTISPKQVSKCGRGGLLIEDVLGRVEDYVFTPDGRFVGRLDHLFKGCVNVVEAQLYQENLDELVCRIVKTENYTIADELSILDQARLRLGSAIDIKFEYLDQIPRMRNEKSRFVVSTINQSKMFDDLVE